MRLLALLVSLLVLNSASSAALAQDGLNLPPDGHVIINLTATETKTMPQDLLVASLRIEAEAKDAREVQATINAAMAKATDAAKKVDGVKVSTGAYSVYKYEPNPEPVREGTPRKKDTLWRGSQTIDLEATDSAALLDLVGNVQGMGFAMNGLSYTLSPAKAESVRDELMVAALKKLSDKAALAARTLGKSGHELLDVNIDGGGPVYPMHKTMMMRGDMAYAEAMPAPVAEAGEADVSLTVSARAILKP